MNIKIIKNKYVNALLLLMLFSAIVHMVVAFCFVLLSGDFYTFNFFNIIDLDLFYPNIFNSFGGNFVSLIFMTTAYFIILKINNKSPSQ